MAAYDDLVAESTRVGWPTHYKEDLTRIDREMLSKQNPVAFVWVLRDYGTHLYIPAAETRHEGPSCYCQGWLCIHQSTLAWLKATLKVNPDARVYVWTEQTRLTEVDQPMAIEFLREQIEQQQGASVPA